jgi:hypothetical protein
MLRHGRRIHSREKAMHVKGAEKPTSGASEKHQHESQN